MVVSHDPHDVKPEVLRRLKEIPDLETYVVHDLPYVQFKDLLEQAKWTLTFGEGLDNYFIEGVFSGAVAFAVYNDDFFTPDFRDLETVYASFPELRDRICTDLKGLDVADRFVDYQREQFNTCADHYNSQNYVRNLRLFYRSNGWI
jgi:hypothetical protein